MAMNRTTPRNRVPKTLTTLVIDLMRREVAAFRKRKDGEHKARSPIEARRAVHGTGAHFAATAAAVAAGAWVARHAVAYAIARAGFNCLAPVDFRLETDLFRSCLTEQSPRSRWLSCCVRSMERSGSRLMSPDTGTSPTRTASRPGLTDKRPGGTGCTWEDELRELGTSISDKIIGIS